jgi:DNA-binding beta-propeller fold protein YncE
MALSTTQPYLFVTCTEDISGLSSFYKGSVYVFNYNTLQFIKKIDGPFYQPHGIAVDDIHKKVFVASRNANSLGPAPHHSNNCGGRNGYYNIINLNTLQLQSNKKYELLVDPYSVDVR